MMEEGIGKIDRKKRGSTRKQTVGNRDRQTDRNWEKGERKQQHVKTEEDRQRRDGWTYPRW